ncbi:MAG: molybdenum cofactor guanylyltransferase [Flavobacteriaceae bacterium]
MSKVNNITGIILAGGKSSRMGTDKGFILFKNKPFIQHCIDALQSFVDDIIIVSNNKLYDQFNAIRVDDLIENSGPLAGIYTGLHHSKTTTNIVLSCDIPLINTALISTLVQHHTTQVNITYVISNNKQMPLIAIYKKDCLPVCLQLLNANERRLKTLLKSVTTNAVTLDETLQKHTVNINTLNELNKLNHELKH